MRLTELLRLRVKDIDYTCDQVLIQDGKDGKFHGQDLRRGGGQVFLPYALARTAS